MKKFRKKSLNCSEIMERLRDGWCIRQRESYRSLSNGEPYVLYSWPQWMEKDLQLTRPPEAPKVLMVSYLALKHRGLLTEVPDPGFRRFVLNTEADT